MAASSINVQALAEYARNIAEARMVDLDIQNRLLHETNPHNGHLHRRGIVAACVVACIPLPKGSGVEVMICASNEQGRLSSIQRDAISSYIRSMFSIKPVVIVNSHFQQVGGFMSIQHGNASRRTAGGAIRRYPQETAAEFLRRAADPTTGAIEIEPPIDLETMKARPLMMAQYLLDAWIVRDEWIKHDWPAHASEATTKILGMCETLRERLLWELDAADTLAPPRLHVAARWTQVRDDLIITFYATEEPPRALLQFESPVSRDCQVSLEEASK